MERRAEVGRIGPLALKSFSIFLTRESVIPIPPKCTVILTEQYTLNITPLERYVKIKRTNSFMYIPRNFLLKGTVFTPDKLPMLPPFGMAVQ
jgi:5-methylcytosine-specific restriction endonuclease McrBC GTP-binding regulatory subunit McrB